MEIVLNILSLAQQGKSRFKILVEAKLNSHQLKQYLNGLMKLDLIEERHVNRKTIYTTTSKGNQFLKQHQNLRIFLNDHSLQ